MSGVLDEDGLSLLLFLSPAPDHRQRLPWVDPTCGSDDRGQCRMGVDRQTTITSVTQPEAKLEMETFGKPLLLMIHLSL